MNGEMISRVHSSMYRQCQERGYAAPVDVLMDAGVLARQLYEDWRYGRVPFLEAVCTVNLHQLSMIMQEIHSYANKNGLKPSFCYYKQWGKKNSKNAVVPLRFSKSGNPDIEKQYATHYVDAQRIAELKETQKE